jgi:hypothetical protein
MPATAAPVRNLLQLGTLSPIEEALLSILEVDPDRPDAPQAAIDLIARTGGDHDQRVMRGAVLRFFCLAAHAGERLGPGGLTLGSIRIDDEVNLGFCRIPFPLTFADCWLQEALDLKHSCIPHLKFQGGRVGGIRGNGLRLRGDMVLERVTVGGELELRNADVEGDLRVTGARIEHPAGVALSGEGMRVRGSIAFTREFAVSGCIFLSSADVGANVVFNNGRLEQPTQATAELADYYRECALIADEISVRGAVMMKEELRVAGEVRMLGARIRGSAEFGGEFRNPGGDALSMDGAHVGGALNLSPGFAAFGSTRLIGTEVGKDLDCSGAWFERELGPGEPEPTNRQEHDILRRIALSAGRVKVRGSVFLDGVTAIGGVRLVCSRIGGELRARGAKFFMPVEGYRHVDARDLGLSVLNARGARIEGGCEFSGCETDGMFVFHRSTIGADLTVQDQKLRGPLVNGLVLKGAEVRGKLCWERTTPTPRTKLVLSHASVGRLVHASDSWPAKGRLFLRGFRYESINICPRPADQRPRPFAAKVRKLIGHSPLRRVGGRAEPEADVRTLTFTDWVQLQPQDSYDPHPYEQLERVLARNGYADAAQEVGIAKEKDRLMLSTHLTVAHRTWRRFLGVTLKHGYDARLMWDAAAFFVVLGVALFGWGSLNGLMAPTSPEVFLDSAYVERGALSPDYPAFNVIAYSVDTFLPPVIDFHQESHWLPNSHRGRTLLHTQAGGVTWGSLLRVYLWGHILAGWVITSLIVVNLTGLIRKR